MLPCGGLVGTDQCCNGDGGGGDGSSSCLPVCVTNSDGKVEVDLGERGEGVEVEEKKKRIEILPVELVSCTNNKLVSSSKCLNLEN